MAPTLKQVCYLESLESAFPGAEKVEGGRDRSVQNHERHRYGRETFPHNRCTSAEGVVEAEIFTFQDLDVTCMSKLYTS